MESIRLIFTMRSQITVYLDEQTKKWLSGYARKAHFKESEVVRFLIEREREIGWLDWAIKHPDPAQLDSSTAEKVVSRSKKKET